MNVAATSESDLHKDPRPSLRPFFVQEYLRIMRGRLAILIWALLVYALLAVPFILAKPAPEVLKALATWLGAENVEAKLILFTWVDASMNKLVVILGPALAGGIIVEERARGSLDLLAAKPIAAGDYFTWKLTAAIAAFATFYIATIIGALITFPWRVVGFDAANFVALSAVHLFAGFFAVSLSATMALFFKRKLTGMLVSVAVLGTLVGLAFLGFYYPAYWILSNCNPFFQGIRLIGTIDNYDIADLLLPIAALIGFNVLVAFIARRRAVHVLEGQ